jgi:hypothetical protein
MYEAPKIHNILEKIQNYAKITWQPYTKTDETAKLGLSILTALQSLIS